MLAPSYEVGTGLDGRVSHLTYALKADGRGRTCHQASGSYLFVSSQSDLVNVQGVLQLDLVDLEVASDGGEHQLAVGSVEDGLESAVMRNAEVFAQGCDGLDAGGGDFLHG